MTASQPPDDHRAAAETLPAGVIHPRRSMQRVVAGVRDYGNRMGIPTVNGAVFFDPRYVGNPLVFCGTVGIMPRKFADKGSAKPGDHIASLRGRDSEARRGRARPARGVGELAQLAALRR